MHKWPISRPSNSHLQDPTKLCQPIQGYTYQVLFHSGFPAKKFMQLSLRIRATCQTNLIRLNFTNRIIFCAIFILSFIPSVLLQYFHSPSQSEFNTHSGTALPLSVTSVISFPYAHSTGAEVFYLVFPPILYFLQKCLKESSY
jgi:hypothetical protein